MEGFIPSLSPGKLIYLASPYSHPDPDTREQRYVAACRAAAALMEVGNHVFSPIAHSHPIEIYGMSGRKDADFWVKQHDAIMWACTEVVVYMLKGWRESIGVKYEMDLAFADRKPVFFLKEDLSNIEEFKV